MATQQQTQLKSMTKDEVAKVSCPSIVQYPYSIPQHNKEGDLWVIVDSIVYDLSKFGAMHPGGIGVLLDDEVGESSQHLFRIS
jgi:cytochrome b involved in lipid metabolism